MQYGSMPTLLFEVCIPVQPLTGAAEGRSSETRWLKEPFCGTSEIQVDSALSPVRLSDASRADGEERSVRRSASACYNRDRPR